MGTVRLAPMRILDEKQVLRLTGCHHLVLTGNGGTEDDVVRRGVYEGRGFAWEHHPSEYSMVLIRTKVGPLGHTRKKPHLRTKSLRTVPMVNDGLVGVL